MVTSDINVNAKDSDGASSLYIAARNGRDTVVGLLLNHEDILVNMGNSEGRNTPLHIGGKLIRRWITR